MLTHPDPGNTPGQTSRLNHGTRQSIRRPIPESHAPRDAPEPDSHCQRTTQPHPMSAAALTARSHIQDALPRPQITPNSINPVSTHAPSAPSPSAFSHSQAIKTRHSRDPPPEGSGQKTQPL